MPEFRYVAIQPSRTAQKKQIGPASYLHDFLVDHQTDASGNVNYGKPISYRWIRAKWLGDAPPLRSLKRHMARLKESGNVWVKKLPFHEGMVVRVLNSAKWAAKPAQMPLFPLPAAVPISRRAADNDVETWKLGRAVKASAKPVENLSNTGLCAVPKVAPRWGQKWHRNEVKNLREEKTYAAAGGRSRPMVVEIQEKPPG